MKVEDKVIILMSYIEDILPTIFNKKDKHIVQTNGYLLENGYIITTYRDIKYATKIYQINPHEKIKCELEFVTKSSEMNLALLRTKLNTKKLTNSPFKKDINFPKKIKLYQNIIKTKRNTKIVGKYYDCKMNGIYMEKNSNNMPLLPYIELSIFDKIDNINGSIIFNSENLIGIVDSKKNKNILVISSIIVNRFLTEYIKKEECHGLCTLLCEVQNIKIDNQTNGLLVTKNYKIKYNSTKKRDKNRLMNKDIIIKIDGKKMDEDGNISISKLILPFNTYISLNFMKGNKISLEILRKDRRLDIELECQPIKKFRYIPMDWNGDSIKINGLKLIELSEDIIEEYFDQDIYLGQTSLHNYGIVPYNNNNKRVVILISIDKKEIEKYREYNLPLSKIDKEFNLPILEKINRRKIDSLDKVRESIKENNTLHFKISNKKSIKIRFKKDKLDKIN